MIDLGVADGLVVTTQGLISPTTSPNGAFLRFAGTSAGTGSTTSITYTVTGAAIRVAADFEQIGTVTRKVDIYCGDELTASFTHSGPWDIEIPSEMKVVYESVCSGNGDNTTTYTNVCYEI